MHPYLLIGPVPVLGETFLVATHLVVRTIFLLIAPWLVLRLTSKRGISRRDTILLLAIGIPAGVLGAHLAALLESGGYRAYDVQRLDAWTGRSAIFGGIFAGVGVAAIYCRLRRIPLTRLLDACAPVMALGEATTRVGCLFAGCCYGRPTTSFLGITFPRGTAVFTDQALRGLIHDPHATRSLPVHATQLYAVAYALVLTGVLLYMLRRRHADGIVFATFLLSYAAWRFVLVYLRADSGSPVAFGMYTSQWWSIAAATVAVAVAAAAYRRHTAAPAWNDVRSP